MVSSAIIDSGPICLLCPTVFVLCNCVYQCLVYCIYISSWWIVHYYYYYHYLDFLSLLFNFYSKSTFSNINTGIPGCSHFSFVVFFPSSHFQSVCFFLSVFEIKYNYIIYLFSFLSTRFLVIEAYFLQTENRWVLFSNPIRPSTSFN